MKDTKFIAPEEMVQAIGPVSKAELEQLRETRERYAPIQVLMPGGETERIIRKFERSRSSTRESYIANRLDRIEGRASDDFWRTRARVKAPTDLDRER